jgi:hypothetical protein
MGELLDIINNDIKQILQGSMSEENKIYVSIRCLTSCFNILDNILTPKEIKQTIQKKINLVYSFIVHIDNINFYDVLLFDVYKNIKRVSSDFAANYHNKCLTKNQNVEYHLNMIMFYNKNNDSVVNLYNYYFNNENYYNCLKLLDFSDPNHFYKKMILCNNICDFDTLQENISKIIEYSKNNPCSPYILICMGLGNNIVNNCVNRFFKHIQNTQQLSLMSPLNSPCIDIEPTNLFNTNEIIHICLIIDNNKYNIENYIFEGKIKYTILDFSVSKYSKLQNIETIHCDLTPSNLNETYKILIKKKFSLCINFSSMNNMLIYDLLTRRIATIQINQNDYLGSSFFNIFDYIIIGKKYLEINSNYFFSEKKIIIDCPFVLNIDYSKNYNIQIQNNYDIIIKTINKYCDIKKIKAFITDYYYRVIKYNIRKVNQGIYKKELLVHRQLKNIVETNNDKLFINYYKLINDINMNKLKESEIYQIYNNIILPKCKHKTYFRFCVLSGSKKISKKDIIAYNKILSQSQKCVLYILETVCFENRNMLIECFDELNRERVYFIPFIEPQLNIFRLKYFDCVLDTLNYNLKNTIYDLLITKIPIITMKGDNLYNTITASILLEYNLTETISDSINGFIKNANEISKNMDLFHKVKNKYQNAKISKYYKKNYIETHLKKHFLNIIS